MDHDRKPINGFSHYEICSTCGRIFSIKKQRYVSACSREPNGILFSNIRGDDGSRKTVTLSRVLAEHFIVKRPLTISTLVKYLDEDPTNLSLDNLVLMNRSQAGFYYHHFEGTMREFIQGFYTVIKNKPQKAA